jgi:hypothetical protein
MPGLRRVFFVVLPRSAEHPGIENAEKLLVKQGFLKSQVWIVRQGFDILVYVGMMTDYRSFCHM